MSQRREEGTDEVNNWLGEDQNWIYIHLDRAKDWNWSEKSTENPPQPITHYCWQIITGAIFSQRSQN